MSILYSITMGTGLALAINGNDYAPGAQLIVENANPSDPDQLWTYVFDPGTQGSILYNPSRNLFAAPKALTNDSPVILFTLNTPLTDSKTWYVGSLSRGVIRATGDDKCNLNLRGNDWVPGKKIVVYTWSNGAPNEVWTSKMIWS